MMNNIYLKALGGLLSVLLLTGLGPNNVLLSSLGVNGLLVFMSFNDDLASLMICTAIGLSSGGA